MDTNKIERYQKLFEIMYRVENIYSQICRDEMLGEEIHFSPYEAQILLSISIHSNELKNMHWYAEQMGLSPSCFTKYIKRLTSKGLVEKYYLKGNRKNIVLQVSELGMKECRIVSQFACETWMKEILTELDSLNDKELATVERIIFLWGKKYQDLLNMKEEASSPTELIPV